MFGFAPLGCLFFGETEPEANPIPFPTDYFPAGPGTVKWRKSRYVLESDERAVAASLQKIGNRGIFSRLRASAPSLEE